MDSSTTHAGTPAKVAPEFGTWPTEGEKLTKVNAVRQKFDTLQADIALLIPEHNNRYMSLVQTKLEEACMFAVKGIAKPN